MLLSQRLELIEVVPCPYCGSENKIPILSKQLLRISRCRDCDLIYTDRRWNSDGIRLYYDEGYYTGKVPGAYRDYFLEEREKSLDFTYKYKCVKPFAPDARLLDIGCANGCSLEAANKIGFKPEGLELSSWATKQNRTVFPIHQTRLEDFEVKDHFDVVTMWDVIEHFTDPNASFKKISEILQPNGILAFTFPDTDSFVARLLGRRWMVFNPYEHYIFFSSSFLEKWLGKYGLQKVMITSEMRYFSLKKFCEKTFTPFVEYFKLVGIENLILRIRIPYKRFAIYRKKGI